MAKRAQSRKAAVRKTPTYPTTASGRRIVPARVKAAAAKAVIEKGKSYAATAAHYGLSRGTVYQAVVARRAAMAEQEAEAKREKRRQQRRQRRQQAAA